MPTARPDLSDLAAGLDGINAVCGHCERPELFCDCPEALKRVLEGWD